MITDLYQEYLYVIGKLKDVHGLHIEVDHRDVHTFFKDKKPLFKLLYGTFQEDPDPAIVVTFHMDLTHPEAIMWFSNIYRIHPLLRLHDSYLEDSNGETYLGEDAMALRETYMSQDILATWLDNHDEEEIKEFVEAKVVGREPKATKTFDSLKQRDEAMIEFSRIKRPDDDDQVH